MTKEEIKKNLFEMAKIDHSSILGTTRIERMFNLEADFIVGLLSEQQSKHEQEMKEFAKSMRLLLKEVDSLKEHCIEHKYIDWEDESIEGCKELDLAIKNSTELLIKFKNR